MILSVKYSDGDLLEQLYSLKISVLTHKDYPELWRLQEDFIELLILHAYKTTRWTKTYVNESRLFDVPIDISSTNHLLSYTGVIYPFFEIPKCIIPSKTPIT